MPGRLGGGEGAKASPMSLKLCKNFKELPVKIVGQRSSQSSSTNNVESLGSFRIFWILPLRTGLRLNKAFH